MTIQETPFQSSLANELTDFVELKRLSGYLYKEAYRTLYHFDELILTNFPDCHTVTKEMCNQWLQQNLHTKVATQMKNVTPIRQFAIYLNDIGIPAYIYPSWIPGKVPRYEAHIFSDSELQSFFSKADCIVPNPESPAMHLCIPTLFRLLYCTGLRSSEARLLRCDEVDLQSGKIIVRNSKFRRRRIVFMGDEMLKYARNFNAAVKIIFPNREAFFPNNRGVFYGKSRFDDWFHQVWDNLPEAANINGNPPRLHDFRHTFAVHCINRWVSEGADIDAMYSYLSEYMGHERYLETDYYLSLSESFYPQLFAKMKKTNEFVLPEVIK